MAEDPTKKGRGTDRRGRGQKRGIRLPSAAVSQELIGKTIGAFVDKTEVTEFERMTDEQLIRSITNGDERKTELLRALLGPGGFDTAH